MSGLISFLAGGHSKAEQLTGSVVQSSIYGLPIPVVYGWARIGGNLIHLPHDPVKSSKGGKSAGWKGGTSADIYTAPVAIGLCEGHPGGIVGIGWVWADKDLKVVWATMASNGWALFVGAGQAPWSYLTTNVPAQALSYPSMAYVVNPSIDLPGYHLRNYNWEVKGLTIFAATNDALPSDVLTDMLTDVSHGYGWIPYGSAGTIIGDFTLYADYCAAAGLLLSPAYTSQKPGVQQLQELFDASNSVALWSDGKFKVIPYGDTALTGNGHTYTPNVTPLYDLTDDDFIAGPGADPVQLVRKPDVDAYNQIFVEFEDRANEYNPSTAEAKDDAAIQAVAAQVGDLGVRPAPKIALPLIKDAQVARTVAQLRLQREQNVRNEYRFTLGIRYSLLEPMDLVTLTDTNLGLSLTPVRIVEVTERADEAGIDILAEDWPFGTATASLYGHASGAGYSPQATITPGNTTAPIIFNGPKPLLSSPLEIWIAPNGGAAWGGCEVWISTDNVTFYKVGATTLKATYGALTASLATNAPLPAIDSTHTLAVDLTATSGALVTVSAADFAALMSLCYVDGEFLAFETAALTSAFHYNLTTLGRGAYGSPVGAHASTTDFVLCDQAIFKLPWPQGTNGQTVYFKFPAFNQYGGGLQDIASVSSQAFVIGSVPGETFLLVTAKLTSGTGMTLAYDVITTNPGDASVSVTLTPSVVNVAITPSTPTTFTLAAGASHTVSYSVTISDIVGSPQGQARWVASATGMNSGTATADIDSLGQDSSQPISLTFDEAGDVLVRFNGASNQINWKYAYNTGTAASPPSTPSDASAYPSGTFVAGRAPSFKLSVGLGLGDIIILKACPTDASGNPGQFVTATASRTNKVGTKTLRIAHTQFVGRDDTARFRHSAASLFNLIASTERFYANFVLPPGCTLRSFSANIYQATVSDAISATLYRVDGGGSSVMIGGTVNGVAGGYATPTSTFTENAGNSPYTVQLDWTSSLAVSVMTALDYAEITYDPPTLFNSV